MANLTKEKIISLIGSDPANAEHYQELGKYHLRNQALEEAEKYLRKSLELDCNDPWTYLYMGNLYNQKERYVDAITYFKQAIELMSDEPTAYWCIAEMHEKLDQLDEANAFYKQAAEIAPDNEELMMKYQEWKECYFQH